MNRTPTPPAQLRLETIREAGLRTLNDPVEVARQLNRKKPASAAPRAQRAAEADHTTFLIDPSAMSLSAVARRLPGRNGTHANPSTVARWVHKGATSTDGSRVKLVATRLGSTLYVTEQSLADFLIALNGPISPEPTPRSPAARRDAADEAVRKLAERGV